MGIQVDYPLFFLLKCGAFQLLWYKNNTWVLYDHPSTFGGLEFDDVASEQFMGYILWEFISLHYRLADHIIGLKKSVWYGGIIITIGHFTMAVPGVVALFGGYTRHSITIRYRTIFSWFGFIVIGTGMQNHCKSSIVGELYGGDSDNDSAKRDAGFQFFTWELISAHY